MTGLLTPLARTLVVHHQVERDIHIWILVMLPVDHVLGPQISKVFLLKGRYKRLRHSPQQRASKSVTCLELTGQLHRALHFIAAGATEANLVDSLVLRPFADLENQVRHANR